MKFSSTLLPLLCATLVTSNPLSLFGGDQTPLADDKGIAVPGNNPLTVSTCMSRSQIPLAILD
jgi:hypothetical protein